MARSITTGIPRALFASLARQLAEWRTKDPFGKILLLIPNTSLMRTVSDELPVEMHRLRGERTVTGLFNVQITTLASWARQLIAPHLIADGRAALPRFASLAVIAEAVRRTKGETEQFLPPQRREAHYPLDADPRDRANFHHALRTEIINVKKAGWTPTMLRERSDRRFAREVAAIYRASEEILREGSWVDLSDVISEASARLINANVREEAARAALFGFTELNALEERFVGALADGPGDVAAFVPWIADAPALALAHSLVNKLAERWRTTPDHVEPKRPPPAYPLITDLCRSGLTATRDIPEISFLSAPDPIQEWLEVARWIWHEMEDDPSLRFSDFHIIAPNLRETRAVARNILLEQAGLRLFEVGGTSLIESDAGRSLLHLLDTLDSGMTRTTVLELVTTCPLRSEWTTCEAGEIPPTEWDRITRIAGVVGGPGIGKSVREEWLVPLRRHAELLGRRIEHDQPGSEEEELQVSKERMQLDLAYTDKLVELVEALEGIRADVAEKERANRWDGWISAVREGWRTLFTFSDEEKNAVVRVEQVIEEMSRYDRIAPLSPPPTRRRMLLDALKESFVAPEKDDAPGVWISDFEDAGYRSPRILIITGLVDTEFPRPNHGSALAVIEEEKIPLYPMLDGEEVRGTGRAITVDRSVAKDHLHFAAALASAREKIRLTYPRCETGKDTQRLPSAAFLDTVASVVEPRRSEAGDPLPWDENALRTTLSERGEWLVNRPIPEPGMERTRLNRDEFDLAVAGQLRDTPFAERWICALGSLAGRGLALLRERQRGGAGPYDGWVATDELRRMLARHVQPTRPISPSRLETYATCPFRYFIQYVLKVGPLPEPADELALDAMKVGSILHELLAGFFRHLREEGMLPLDAALREEYRRLFTRFAERRREKSAFRTDLPAPVAWDAQWKVLTDRAWRAVEAALREADRWEPRFMELGLGIVRPSLERESTQEPILLSVKGQGEVALRGIVDRVDFSRSGAFARIVDYKSGKKTRIRPDAGHTDAGRRVQLLVYAAGLNALLRRRGGGRVVNEACYDFLRERLPESATPDSADWPLVTLDEGTLREAATELSNVLKTVLDGIREGAFLPIPDVPPNSRYGACASCDVAPACGSLTDLTARWNRIICDERARPLVMLRTGQADGEENGDGDAS